MSKLSEVIKELGIEPTRMKRAMAMDPTDDDDDAPAGIPEALWRATGDVWSFKAGLSNGHIVEFEHATVYDDGWVHLHDAVLLVELDGTSRLTDLNRGIDVQLSHIVWVVDMPS